MKNKTLIYEMLAWLGELKQINEKGTNGTRLALDCLFHDTPESLATALIEPAAGYVDENMTDAPACEAIVMNLWGKKALDEMTLRHAGELLKKMSTDERRGFLKASGISI